MATPRNSVLIDVDGHVNNAGTSLAINVEKAKEWTAGPTRAGEGSATTGIWTSSPMRSAFLPDSAMIFTPYSSHTFGIPSPLPRAYLSPSGCIPPARPKTFRSIPRSTFAPTDDSLQCRRRRYAVAEKALIASGKRSSTEASPRKLQIHVLRQATAVLHAHAEAARIRSEKLRELLADAARDRKMDSQELADKKRERWMEERRSLVVNKEVELLTEQVTVLSSPQPPVTPICSKAKEQQNLARFFVSTSSMLPLHTHTRRSNYKHRRHVNLNDVSASHLHYSLPSRERERLTAELRNASMKIEQDVKRSFEREECESSLLTLDSNDSQNACSSQLSEITTPVTPISTSTFIQSPTSSNFTTAKSSISSHPSYFGDLCDDTCSDDGTATIYTSSPSIVRPVSEVLADLENIPIEMPPYFNDLLNDFGDEKPDASYLPISLEDSSSDATLSANLAGLSSSAARHLANDDIDSIVFVGQAGDRAHDWLTTEDGRATSTRRPVNLAPTTISPPHTPSHQHVFSVTLPSSSRSSFLSSLLSPSSTDLSRSPTPKPNRQKKWPSLGHIQSLLFRPESHTMQASLTPPASPSLTSLSPSSSWPRVKPQKKRRTLRRPNALPSPSESYAPTLSPTPPAIPPSSASDSQNVTLRPLTPFQWTRCGRHGHSISLANLFSSSPSPSHHRQTPSTAFLGTEKGPAVTNPFDATTPVLSVPACQTLDTILESQSAAMSPFTAGSVDRSKSQSRTGFRRALSLRFLKSNASN